MIFLRSRSVGFLVGLFLLPAVFATSFAPIAAGAASFASGEASQAASLSLGESVAFDLVLQELEVSLNPTYQGAFIGLVLGFVASLLPSIASFVATGAFIPSVLWPILTGGAIGAVQVFGTIGGLVISQAVTTLIDGGEKALQDKIGTTGEVDPDGTLRQVTIVIPGKGCEKYTTMDKLPYEIQRDISKPKENTPNKTSFNLIKVAHAQAGGDGGDAASDGSAGAGASGNGTAGSSSTAGDAADASTDGSAGTGPSGNSSANGNSAGTGTDGNAASSGPSGGGAGADGTAGGGDAGDAGGDGVINTPDAKNNGEIKATKQNPCPIAASFPMSLDGNHKSMPINQDLTLTWTAVSYYKACSGAGGAWPTGLKKFSITPTTETFNVGDETGTMWHSFTCVFDYPDSPDGKEGLHFEKIVSYRVDVGVPEGVVYSKNGERNGDVPPVTKIQYPPCGAKCAFGSDVTIKTESEDKDGKVTLLELWLNGKQHITKVDPPYPFNFELGKLKAGKYNLFVRSRDDGPGNTKSNTIDFEVLPAKPPTIALKYPPCGNRCSEKESLLFSADVGSEGGESVTSVEVLVNGKAVIDSKEPPYLFDLSGLTGGVYRITAVAKAADGQTTTSPPLTFTYTGPVAATAGSGSSSGTGTGSTSSGGSFQPTATSLQTNLPPTIDVTANPAQLREGQLLTIEWAAKGAVYCLAIDDWPRPTIFSRDNKFYKPVSGSQRIYFVNPGAVYTLQCFNVAGQSSKVSVRAEAASASSNEPVSITLKIIKG